jgi:hypothetical protein
MTNNQCQSVRLDYDSARRALFPRHVGHLTERLRKKGVGGFAFSSANHSNNALQMFT